MVNAVDLTCVTVTYNSAADLRGCWSNGVPANVEWIVVDNSSTDESVDLAQSVGARVVPLPRNVGFSAANNVGASLATGRHLMFVNPDVVIDAEGARAIAAFLDEHDVLVAPQLMNDDGSAQENGRMAPFAWRKVLHFLGSKRSSTSYEVTAAPGEVRPVVWAIGAAIGLRRETFAELKGWDSRFFIYYEDSDICLRALGANRQTVLNGNVRWMHKWARATRKGFSIQSWRYEVASGCRFYRRYLGLLLPPAVSRRWRKFEDGLQQSIT